MGGMKINEINVCVLASPGVYSWARSTGATSPAGGNFKAILENADLPEVVENEWSQ
mgnify:CR=1 FL=1